MNIWSDKILSKYQKIVDSWNKYQPIGYEATMVGVNGEGAELLLKESNRNRTTADLDKASRFKAIETGSKFLKSDRLLFINVSNYSIIRGDLDFPEGVDLRRIVLEITEEVPLSDKLMKMVGELRARGVRLAIDDFGRGYSNFDVFTKLPISYLKLDRQFVEGLFTEKSYAAVRHINMMCQACGVDLIAEGVESEEQKDFLKQMGVRYMQGYYFHRPQKYPQILRTV